jgi:cytochrome c oxidase cbb3-type subunit 3
MKFINYLTSIAGVEIFPLISLLIFFLFFFALSIYMFRADKNHIAYMSELPFTDENENPDNRKQ